MMSIVRWQPFSELISLRQAMDKLFGDSLVTPSHLLSTFDPGFTTPLDMYQTPNEVVIKATLPGVKPEEIDIAVTGDTLTIKGETKAEEEIKQEDYLYREHRYGTFHRAVTLPGGVKSDKAEASFENGVLTLTIPKSEQVKPQKVKVKAKGATEGKK